MAAYNSAQQRRIAKLDSDEFYLLGVTVNATDVIYQVSGSQSNLYTLKLTSDRRMTCGCPDALMHCPRQGCVCKHVCYILLRVLRHPDLGPLRADDVETLRRRSALLRTATRDPRLEPGEEPARRPVIGVKAPHAADTRFGDTARVQMDAGDLCPICHDDIVEQDKLHDTNPLVVCPVCKVLVHKRCQKRWLAFDKRKSCCNCRSDVWKAWSP